MAGENSILTDLQGGTDGKDSGRESFHPSNQSHSTKSAGSKLLESENCGVAVNCGLKICTATHGSPEPPPVAHER